MSTATRITVEQFLEMAERGEFEPPNHRVELIRGEVVPKEPRGPMSPAHAPHHGTIIALTRWSMEVLPLAVADLSIQQGIEIAALDSMPEPDIAWLVTKNYTEKLPIPADVLLAIEVSDSSLRKDRRVKAPLYAEAGIRDFWVVNIPGRCVEVFRDPADGVYRELTTHGAGALVRPLAFPEVALPVDRIFPA